MRIAFTKVATYKIGRKAVPVEEGEEKEVPADQAEYYISQKVAKVSKAKATQDVKAKPGPKKKAPEEPKED